MNPLLIGAIAVGALALLGGGGSGSSGATVRGKGVLVRSLDHAGGVSGTVAAVANLGCSWVALQTMHQEAERTKTFASSTLGSFVAACNDAGIDVWIWGYVRPQGGRLAEFLADVRARIAEVPGIAGIMVNLEGPWLGVGVNEAAAFAQALEVATGTLPLGLCSFGGGPPSVPTFPWRAFVGRPRWSGWPMIYDIHNNLGEAYPARAVATWWEMFPEVVVLWGAAQNKTAADMKAMADRTPPVAAAGWWDLYWLTLGNAEAANKRRFVTQFPAGTDFRWT